MSDAVGEPLAAHSYMLSAMRRFCPLWIWLATTSVACAPKAVDLAEGPREYVANDYETVLRHWTRQAELTNVSQMDNVLNVTATYESWDFRWAYVVRYAEDYRLTVDQRHDLLQRSLAESRDLHTFYLALYSQKYKWNDLTARQPAWIVRLIDDEGTETAPSSIDVIKRPGAIELTYFPYTTPWRSVFRVSFPKVRADGRPTISSAARWFGLRFAGAQGNEELVWELAGS
ncbi:MAG: hypothetical protein ACOY0T_14420 [Myxococcota bacterium]